MSAQDQSKPQDVVGIGIAFMAGGAYFCLVALGVLPMPDGGANAPWPILFCAGLAFFFAGCTCIVRSKAGMNDKQDEVPESAPLWTKLSYRVFGIAIVGSLAIVGTWIAIGSGPRSFNVSGPLFETRTTGELIGRSVFGLGAVIVWIYVIALTVGTVRKFFDRRGG
ncbi:MAG: hypothetical protein FJX62_07745 [Alphaproteobacteria bacterium]|nr:hypothetical protein [Alphaproteobacteria bacterium]